MHAVAAGYIYCTDLPLYMQFKCTHPGTIFTYSFLGFHFVWCRNDCSFKNCIFIIDSCAPGKYPVQHTLFMAINLHVSHQKGSLDFISSTPRLSLISNSNFFHILILKFKTNLCLFRPSFTTTMRDIYQNWNRQNLEHLLMTTNQIIALIYKVKLNKLKTREADWLHCAKYPKSVFPITHHKRKFIILFL